ncbi:hypothetical protein WJ96_05185 [Burkholderia ubonensis]|uniref:Uncharacterized protein n=1 Tax=Burkholderia ubonensis TaxID=101571 RepID=A0AAW3MY93_9BURK|nr:hypothetical protein WJ93_07005 [Burkholderia ubonensis]KVP96618.1 hypothetical protein WJ97_12095 [Burkholderia ubonensis]KVP97965.1 hypothetical protein WJ96_05185 [Burkholderia ubonensis]KVZ92662.1 hypothetical protein WL25_16840 [Burkholderia ubonensis]
MDGLAAHEFVDDFVAQHFTSLRITARNGALGQAHCGRGAALVPETCELEDEALGFCLVHE